MDSILFSDMENNLAMIPNTFSNISFSISRNTVFDFVISLNKMGHIGGGEGCLDF